MYSPAVRRRALGLLARGSSLNAASNLLGVSRSAIREWRDGGIQAPEDCPATDGLGPAYAALFGFYLGDGCLSAHPRTYALRISCDAAWPGVVEDVSTCIASVHPERPVHRVHAPGTIVVQNYWKHWPCLFPQHGPRRKHERELVMAAWQRLIVEEHPVDFLRGLFHSDGCRVNNWASRVVAGERLRYYYPRWQFTNESGDIKRWCGEALDLLEIPWRVSNRKTLSVSTRAGVAALDGQIGQKS